MQCRCRPRRSDMPHKFSPSSATFPGLNEHSTSTPCTFSSFHCFLFWLWRLYFLTAYLSYTTVSSFLSLHFLHDLMPLHFTYLQAWTEVSLLSTSEAENKWLKMTSRARPMTNAKRVKLILYFPVSPSQHNPVISTSANANPAIAQGKQTMELLFSFLHPQHHPLACDTLVNNGI